MYNTRYLAAAIGGILWSLVLPALPYAALCTAMVCADAVTAWTLSRRVARRYGRKARNAGAGKIQSRRMARMLVTLGKIYALLILASAIDAVIMRDAGSVSALRFSAGAVCLWQTVSILENEASCSDASWARIARRWLIDKAKRHFTP
ncbi:MAG: hypothetical protein Q4F07_00135 [Bacteroidales bacterium]|nr:hypothetical protein [Bacteroidales bacterium]